MRIYWLWIFIEETYIFIIAIWLIIAVILKDSRHYKTYLTVSAVIYTLLLLYSTLFGRTASTEYKMELSFLWEYRLALSGNNAWWIQIFDNIMLFVPMGWLWGGLREYYPTLCSSSQGSMRDVRTEDGRTRENCEKNSKKNGIRKSQLFKAFIFALCVSAAIELCQLVFRLGLFEFDDILNNTIGMIVGYGVYVRWGESEKLTTLYGNLDH